MISDVYRNVYGEDEECIICGKSVAEGRGFAHIKYREEMVPLCCPLCMETFEKNPPVYFRRREMKKMTASLSRNAKRCEEK